MTCIAFMGTGTMGLPMARHLLERGFELRAWNRTPKRAAPLREKGGQVTDDPAAAARGADLLVTMLSDADAVVEVAERVLDALEPGSVWVQMSTIGVEGTARCAELAARSNAGFVDAPVLGTRAPAEKAQLVILASGQDQHLRACEGLFDAVGQRTLRVGAAGAGTRAKLVVNNWVVGVVAVLAETISLAETLGIDPQLFFDAIDGGPLDLPYARLKGQAMIERRFDDASFRLALSRKDAELVLAAAAGENLEMPVGEAIARRARRAESAGHGDLDMAATLLATVPADGAS